MSNRIHGSPLPEKVYINIIYIIPGKAGSEKKKIMSFYVD